MDDEKTPVEAPVPESESAEQQLTPPDGGGAGGLGGLGSGKEPWRSGGGCVRLPLVGCAIGIVLLMVALVIGVSLVRRSVWMTAERARRQVVQGLPFQLPPGERLRMTRNLDRFRTILETSPDPYPMMGEFVNRVRAAFADGRFTAEEIEELNLFLEEKIGEAGIPGMQLGSRISDFGFRIFRRVEREISSTQPVALGCVDRNRSGFRKENQPFPCQRAHSWDIRPNSHGRFFAPINPKSEIRNPRSVPV